MRTTSLETVIVTIALLTVVSVGLTIADDARPTVWNADGNGVAIGGFDPVAYVEDGLARAGDPAFEATHDGARFRFATADHRDAFVAAPERYVPAFGGWCAFGLAMDEDATGYLRGYYPVDPTAFRVIDGRTHLFYRNDTFDALAAWDRDPDRLGADARATWSRLADGTLDRSPPASGLISRPTSSDAGHGVEACSEDPRYRVLDFWIGRWDVYADGNPVGTNLIESVLDGCAVEERWTSASGGEGRSLFYVPPGGDRMVQVWVTATALRTGGVKEKRLVPGHPGPGVRFQGTLPHPSGTTYEDRTTLTPLPDGRVRQVIEVSTDGTTWRTTFDAVYVPSGSEPPGDGASSP